MTPARRTLLLALRFLLAAPAGAAMPDRPSILWITVEDMSPFAAAPGTTVWSQANRLGWRHSPLVSTTLN